MLDHRLRPFKERALRPIAALLVRHVPAGALTVMSFVLCVGAGVAAWREQSVVAVVCWLTGRLLDGLDGATARASGSVSDAGSYADFLLDSIGYAAVPIGIAFGAGDIATWQVVGLLLASFYINTVSLLMLSALLERRHASSEFVGQTSVVLPKGLVEGTETIVFFTVALAFSSIARTVFIVMTFGVAISVIQRSVVAQREWVRERSAAR